MPLEPLYVAVEFVSGGSLDKLLRKSRVQKCREQEQPPYANIWSRLTERQLLQIASDIANGMKELTITRDVGTSTDDYSYLYERPREQGRVYDEDYFSGDDDKVKFYTGLPTFQILKKTFDFIAPHSTRRSPQTALNKFQEFIMVLIKLRLNVSHQDLAYRFSVSRFLVSRIFNSWIVLMDIRLSPLIVWPDR